MQKLGPLLSAQQTWFYIESRCLARLLRQTLCLSVGAVMDFFVAGVCLLDTSESIERKAQQNNYRDISHFTSSGDSKKPVSLLCNCPPPRQCCMWVRCSSPC